ncbi:MAG: hypothetical protein AAFU67_17260, partial [Bacteroidota bacterium]
SDAEIAEKGRPVTAFASLRFRRGRFRVRQPDGQGTNYSKQGECTNLLRAFGSMVLKIRCFNLDYAIGFDGGLKRVVFLVIESDFSVR